MPALCGGLGGASTCMCAVWSSTAGMSNLLRRTMADAKCWSHGMFGRASLGDPRNTRRLCAMAATAARSPGGRVTQVFREDAARQGAYRFLENDAVSAHSMSAAMSAGTVRMCVEARLKKFYVAGDGSSICVADVGERKGTGRIGSKGKARGFEVMSGLAMAPDGTPVGLCSQTFWARRGPRAKDRSYTRPVPMRETRYWIEMMEDVVARTRAANAEASTRCRPHFLFDRGADAWVVLQRAVELREHADVTVRAAQNRRVVHPYARHLREQLMRGPALCSYALDVPGSPSRTARRAHLEVRACEVTLKLRGGPVTLSAVQAREFDTTPKGEPPIDWLLLTTQRVATAADALAVIDGYALRWRVEEFHKAWKSSVCHVEDTQLQSAEAIQKWAIVLAAVAARSLHLTHAARTSPDAPAESELSGEEIDAVIVLRRPKGFKLGDRPSLQQVVRWIADLGGYTGKSSGGPPGAIVIGRGMREVQAATRAIRNLLEMKQNEKL